MAAVVFEARTPAAGPRSHRAGPPARWEEIAPPMARETARPPRLRLDGPGKRNQLRHRHLRLRLVPREAAS